MRKDGCTQLIHFVSFVSLFKFVRHSSDKDRLTASDGRKDGRTDGRTDGYGRQFPKTSDGNFQFKHPPPKKNIRFRIARRNAKALYYPNTATLLLSLQKP